MPPSYDAERHSLYCAVLATPFDLDHKRKFTLKIEGKPDRHAQIPALHAKHVQYWMQHTYGDPA